MAIWENILLSGRGRKLVRQLERERSARSTQISNAWKIDFQPLEKSTRLLDTHKYGFMVVFMKTTVELPDRLLIEAKKKAAELRRPLKSLIEEGLRNELQLLNNVKPKKKKTVNWNKVTAPGGIPNGLDLTDRDKMYDWLDRHS